MIILKINIKKLKNIYYLHVFLNKKHLKKNDCKYFCSRDPMMLDSATAF